MSTQIDVTSQLLDGSFTNLDEKFHTGTRGQHLYTQHSPGTHKALANEGFPYIANPWDMRKHGTVQPGMYGALFGQYDGDGQGDRLSHGGVTWPALDTTRDTTRHNMKTTRAMPDNSTDIHTRISSSSSSQNSQPNRTSGRGRRTTSKTEPTHPAHPRRNSRHDGKDQEPRDPADAKRRKFLENNRVAAGKCRQKKKVWEKNLEETNSELESQNQRLRSECKGLAEEVALVKAQIMGHAACRDPSIDMWIENEANRIVRNMSGRTMDLAFANDGVKTEVGGSY